MRTPSRYFFFGRSPNFFIPADNPSGFCQKTHGPDSLRRTARMVRFLYRKCDPLLAWRTFSVNHSKIAAASFIDEVRYDVPEGRPRSRFQAKGAGRSKFGEKGILFFDPLDQSQDFAPFAPRVPFHFRPKVPSRSRPSHRQIRAPGHDRSSASSGLQTGCGARSPGPFFTRLARFKNE